MPILSTRRDLLGGLLTVAGGLRLVPPSHADGIDSDVTFVFAADVHACLAADGLAPKCREAGKSDENLRRHVAAINGLSRQHWPGASGGLGGTLVSAGRPIGSPRAVVLGGDLTDDGGGQVRLPAEGEQLKQFSRHYRQGSGADQLHCPVYIGLGNHDLDQDGPAGQRDWYRREMRDFVALNHRRTAFYTPPLPAGDYDIFSDNYSWDWGGLHLVQTQRFAGDTTKGAIDSLPWLRSNLAANAADGKPVILFQHYGWDPFSTERWNPARKSFDLVGEGPAHWWSDEQRSALLDAIAGYNVIAIFHGHEHPTPMIYEAGDYDVFKPTAAYLGGFAIVRVTGHFMDVALAEALGDGGITFLKTFSKPLSSPRR